MGVINGAAVIIRPLPPYLAWAKHDDNIGHIYGLEEAEG